MFQSLFRLCTGETLEIAQEMTIQNGDASMISNDCENATAMILHHSDDEVLAEKKLHSNSKRHKAEKAKKLKQKKASKSNYAR